MRMMLGCIKKYKRRRREGEQLRQMVSLIDRLRLPVLILRLDRGKKRKESLGTKGEKIPTSSFIEF
jgi:hypothetical protein